MLMMPVVRAEIIGGDALGRGQEPALCWWLPDGAGYRAFEVRPRPGGGITWASARHIGPFGPIDVTWRRDGGSMELDLLVPGGTRATVVMPGAEPRDAGPGRHHWTGAAPAD
jgi:hypothetical protein